MIYAVGIREQCFHASTVIIEYVRQLQPGKYYPAFIFLDSLHTICFVE